jgi:hypothetical protein
MEKHPEWVIILFTKDQKRPKKFQNWDQRFLLKSKNWTTLVNSTNGQIQCAKHVEPNHAASQVKFGQ